MLDQLQGNVCNVLGMGFGPVGCPTSRHVNSTNSLYLLRHVKNKVTRREKNYTNVLPRRVLSIRRKSVIVMCLECRDGLTLYTLNSSIRESKHEKTAFIDETMSIAPSMVE